jgi:plastocyanin
MAATGRREDAPMGTGWKRTFAGGMLALGLLGAACSNYGGTNDLTPAPASSGAPSTSAPPATTAAGGTTSGGGTISCDKNGGGSVALTQQGFAFQPATFSAKSCDTVNVDNKDTAEHTFTVVGSAINVTLPGGSQNSAQLNLPPGTYIFYCRFHGSPDGSGMAGKLTVT